MEEFFFKIRRCPDLPTQAQYSLWAYNEHDGSYCLGCYSVGWNEIQDSMTIMAATLEYAKSG